MKFDYKNKKWKDWNQNHFYNYFLKNNIEKIEKNSKKLKWYLENE
jgi:hypothetical protein